MSHISTSAFVSLALLIASKTTEAGSEFSALLIISQFARFDQTSNCSTAAALKVSAAATITFFPSLWSLDAIFPIEVVFPNSIYSYN